MSIHTVSFVMCHSRFRGGVGHGDTCFVTLLLQVTIHMLLYSELAARGSHADVDSGDLYL